MPNTRVSNNVFSYLGYRMAAECALNALLQKVMDNKEDPGTAYCSIFTFYIILHFVFIENFLIM
jgi:hypothetical protein